MESASYMPDCLTACCVAAIAAVMGYYVALLLQSPSWPWRHLAWGFGMLTFFTPPLLTGYAYADFSFVMTRPASQRLLFYGALQVARSLPLAAVIWLIAPSRVTSEADFLLRQLAPRLRGRELLWHRLRLAWQGGAGTACVIGAILFVVTFSEFELASFLALDKWTVLVFDAQVGGTAWFYSLRSIAGPVAAASVVALAATSAVGGRLRHEQPGNGVLHGTPGNAGAGMVALLLGVLLVCGLPVAIVMRGAWPALPQMVPRFALHRELLHTLAIAGVAGSLALWVARLAVQKGWAFRLVLLPLLMVPGLTGALVLGLGCLALVQLPVLWHFRETPLPLVGASLWLILPVALLLELLLSRYRRSADHHVACLLAASPLLGVRRSAAVIQWIRYRRGAYLALAVLICQLCYEITLSTLLAPVAMPLAAPRLYNFMHYGRSHLLSASLLFSLGLPLLLLLAGGLVYRSWRSWHVTTVDV